MFKKFTNKVKNSFHLDVEDPGRFWPHSSLDVSSTSNAPVPRSTVSLNDTANQAAGSVAWKGLETALRLLEKSAGAFPPLKSAVSGLVACLDLTQVNYSFGFDLLDVVFEVDLRQSSGTVKSMKT